MIPILRLSIDADRQRAETLVAELRLDAKAAVLNSGQRAEQAAVVRQIMADVAQRGDAALVDSSRKFDDPNFSASQLRVSPKEMADAAGRLPADELAALRRSIAQVREYQRHVMPADPKPLKRGGVELGMRFTPLDSVGLLVPGGRGAYA